MDNTEWKELSRFALEDVDIPKEKYDEIISEYRERFPKSDVDMFIDDLAAISTAKHHSHYRITPERVLPLQFLIPFTDAPIHIFKRGGSFWAVSENSKDFYNFKQASE